MMRAIPNWPPERRRRAALLMLLAACAIAAAIVVIPLWLAHRHYNEALEDIDRRLARYERLADSRPELKRKLDAVRALDSRRFFLKASAGSLSAAEIQERVRQFVESNGGRLISVQVVQPKEEGRFRQMTVTVQANANIAAMRKILRGVETGEPYLFVDSLTVRAQVPPGFKPTPGFEPEMFIQLDISGFAVAG